MRLSAQVCHYLHCFTIIFHVGQVNFSSLLVCYFSAINWHVSAVLFSLYNLIKGEENGPTAGSYDVNQPHTNMNTAPAYPNAYTAEPDSKA